MAEIFKPDGGVVFECDHCDSELCTYSTDYVENLRNAELRGWSVTDDDVICPSCISLQKSQDKAQEEDDESRN